MSKSKSTSDSGGISKQEEKTRNLTFTPKDAGLVDVIYEAFQFPQFHGIVGFKLKKAELEAFTTSKRYTHGEVIEGLKQTLIDSMGDGNV